jgi:hypothetical protein
MHNALWRLTAIALDVPLLMLGLLVEWRIRHLRASGWQDWIATAPALPARGQTATAYALNRGFSTATLA